MITVKGPDGSSFSFPLGTAPTVIEKAMADHYGSMAPKDTGMSGDQARANAAGDTRAKMRTEDISAAYDVAQQRGDRAEQQAMARAFVQRERQDSPLATAINDRVRAVARGVPLLGGIADEANAGIRSLFGGNYEKELDYERAKDRTFDDANPWTSTGLQVAGGVASGVGAAPAAGALLRGMPRAGALLTGASGGATIGAADGFTRGEDGPGGRAESALMGGAVGGAVGLAAPVVGKAIGAGVNKVADAMAQRDTLRGMGLSRPSANILTRAMEADGTIGGVGARNIGAAGPQGMLVDAGPNSVALLDTALQRTGSGQNMAREAVERRVGAATQQVGDALDTTLGQPVGIATTEQGIRRGSQAARSAAYDAAYASPIDYADPLAVSLQDTLKRVPSEAVSLANRMMRTEGAQSQQILARIADDGTVTYEQLPDVRQWDYITRALNQMAKSGEGQGALGGQTDIGRLYQGLSGDIRGSLRELVPAYGNALDTAAEPIAARNALRLGEGLLSPSVPRDEAAMALRGMSQAELANVRAGIRSGIDETLANVRRTMTDPNVDARQAVQALRTFSSDAVRDKIRMVVGDAEAAQLFGSLDEAARAFNLRAGVAENSKTFARTAAADEVARQSEPGAFGLLMQGRPMAASQRLLRSATGAGPEQQAAREDGIYAEIVRALTERQGPAAQRYAQDLADVARRTGQASAGGDALGTLIAGGAAAPAQQQIYQALDQQRQRRLPR